ncbi:MAG: hypothetical protein R2747_13665 [Pyrinomonadaceae bacterium]
MEFFGRFCPKIIKNNQLAVIFLLANLFFCSFAFDWDKAFSYIKDIDKTGCRPVAEVPSFGIYNSAPPPPEEILTGLLVLISLPTLAATAILTESLKTDHPRWCPETFEVIEIFAIMFFNSFYWILLAHLIEMAHGNYLRSKPEPEKPLSIFSD